MRITVRPSGPLRGALRPPSDKSMTHRAYMLGAIANGKSIIRSPLTGEDCESTLRCLEAMGLSAARSSSGDVLLSPAANWTQPASALDCGNSGTTIRLLSGLIASRSLDVTLTGDVSLSRRPMKRIAEPLRLMGATIEGDTPPLRIKGGDLKGIDFRSPVSSAQIKSCVLLAGLRAEGETWVTEPSKSRDHTERMLTACGVHVLTIKQDPARGNAVGVKGKSQPEGYEFTVPADISSAAFWMVAAAIVPDSSVLLKGVGINPTRTGVLDVFAQSEIPIRLESMAEELGEPVADVAVWSGAGPYPFIIEGPLVPRLIDEIPVLAVMATQLDGVSKIRDAGELRVKESDRIEKVAEGLRAMGAVVETLEDGMEIQGPVRLKGAGIDAEGDHRIAMAFVIAGLAADGETIIEGAESISTSYPSFLEDLAKFSGMNLVS